VIDWDGFSLLERIRCGLFSSAPPRERMHVMGYAHLYYESVAGSLMSSRGPDHGADYNVAGPRSWPARVSLYQRRRMFAAFVQMMVPTADDTIGDIGVTSDRTHDHSNYLEAWYPYKTKITAIGVENASFLEQAYPGVTFVRASGLELPFSDKSFDFVHSSAVLEHVGGAANQAQFLSELWRVAKRGIFVTTPNRWFPIELHTVLPLLHYLPPHHYRQLLRRLGLDFFADESNLNLLSKSTLSAAARKAGITPFCIHFARLLGLSSNLILVAKKRETAQRYKPG